MGFARLEIMHFIWYIILVMLYSLKYILRPQICQQIWCRVHQWSLPCVVASG